jgi:hypothetical protein
VKVKDILTDESRWTQGALARDERGEPCEPGDDRARRWCVLGALCRVAADDAAINAAIDAVGQAVGVHDYTLAIEEIGEWNDCPSRTFDEVRHVIEKADV